MDNYISKEYIAEHIKACWINGRPKYSPELHEVLSWIDEVPSEDVQPVRHGHWIIWDEIIAGIYHTVSECSECGFTTDKMQREEMPYCPHCGARMDKERKEK